MAGAVRTSSRVLPLTVGLKSDGYVRRQLSFGASEIRRLPAPHRHLPDPPIRDPRFPIRDRVFGIRHFGIRHYH
jgi:hypothetical protein